MTKESAWLRLSVLSTIAKMGCKYVWQGYSIPMARVCLKMMVVS